MPPFIAIPEDKGQPQKPHSGSLEAREEEEMQASWSSLADRMGDLARFFGLNLSAPAGPQARKDEEPAFGVQRTQSCDAPKPEDPQPPVSNASESPRDSQLGGVSEPLKATELIIPEHPEAEESHRRSSPWDPLCPKCALPLPGPDDAPHQCAESPPMEFTMRRVHSVKAFSKSVIIRPMKRSHSENVLQGSSGRKLWSNIDDSAEEPCVWVEAGGMANRPSSKDRTGRRSSYNSQIGKHLDKSMLATFNSSAPNSPHANEGDWTFHMDHRRKSKPCSELDLEDSTPQSPARNKSRIFNKGCEGLLLGILLTRPSNHEF